MTDTYLRLTIDRFVGFHRALGLPDVDLTGGDARFSIRIEPNAPTAIFDLAPVRTGDGLTIAVTTVDGRPYSVVNVDLSSPIAGLPFGQEIADPVELFHDLLVKTATGSWRRACHGSVFVRPGAARPA